MSHESHAEGVHCFVPHACAACVGQECHRCGLVFAMLGGGRCQWQFPVPGLAYSFLAYQPEVATCAGRRPEVVL